MSGIVNLLRPRRLLHRDFVYPQPGHMITSPSPSSQRFLGMSGDDLMSWLMDFILDDFDVVVVVVVVGRSRLELLNRPYILARGREQRQTRQ